MRFEAVPPGQLATRINPTASPGSSLQSRAANQPDNGMTVYCSKNPSATAPGIFASRLKSSTVSVSPMLNITIVSAHTTHGPENQRNVSGQISAITDEAT